MTYASELSALREEIEQGGARPSVIDSKVSSILGIGDEKMPHDLLALLSDTAEHDEGMFSLVHAAESVDDLPYVHALLAVFPALASSSPRWASIVLMRVLNNDNAKEHIVRELRAATQSVKTAVREISLQINRVSPEFLAKTAPVLIAAAPPKLTPVH
jgi:L-fucose mutarotase/ribose pyranase (RbsD/FucU family)